MGDTISYDSIPTITTSDKCGLNSYISGLGFVTLEPSGVSKAGPSRAWTLPNIQSAHPSAKNLGRKGLKVNFYILRSLSEENTRTKSVFGSYL